MKKLYFIILLFIISQNSFSQTTWSPTGAKWHYSYGTMSGGGYRVVSYVSDTTVAGINCKKLRDDLTFGTQQNNSTGTSYFFTYENNSIVYGYSSFGWDTIYNFNANPNEHWGVFLARAMLDLIIDEPSFGANRFENYRTNKDSETEISIYPNPSNGIFEIYYSQNISEVSVCDLSGKELTKALLDGQIGFSNLDLTKLNSGLYLLKFFSQTSVVVNKKITIIK